VKFCLRCINLYTEKSGLVDEYGSEYLTTSLVHEDELEFATDEDVIGG
jgi:hypothetical protein